MRCGKVQQLIDAYVDGTSGAAERAAVDQHTRKCAACARTLAQSRILAEAMRSMPARPVSRGFEQRLMEAVAEREPAPHAFPVGAWIERLRLRFEWRLRTPALLTASSLAVAVLAGVVAPGMWEQHAAREAQRRDFVRSAVNRHEELNEATSVNWDAVDSSIELSTGDVLSDPRHTP